MSHGIADALGGDGPVVLLETRFSGERVLVPVPQAQGTRFSGERVLVPVPQAQGRTLLARDPAAVVVAGRTRAFVATAAGTTTILGSPFEVLRHLHARLRADHPEGALVGALAYEAARPPRSPAEPPLLVALVVPRLDVKDPAPGPDLGRVAWDAWQEAHAPVPPLAAAATVPADRYALGACSSMSREEHRRLVLRLQDHIGRGDIYQANLAQRFAVSCPRGGLALYEQLRAVSPTPFAGYLRVGPLEIASASPERLLLVDGGVAQTRPIAGTRRRSDDPARDAALRAELVLSEKERAEHLMLVGLSRNDLGRVAEIGSVHVDELMGVEEYSHVRHIVSNVRARLAPGRGPLDAFAAIFPGGTITGVPKRRCMELLDDLEPVRRGFYTGALFYLTADGRLDANILIRSAVVQDGVATWHAGGGIVADSDPDREYEETLHKAEAVRAALAAIG